jgi:hypothetical protein
VASRGARISIVFVVLLMVLGGALFVVDRVAANAAEDRIAAEVKKELVARKVNSATDPEVRLGGFPFLTQVIDGRYEKITIDIDRPEIDLVKLTSLRVVATNVRADAGSLLRGTGDVVADRVTGTATMTWEQVRPLLELANLPSAVDPSAVDLKVLNNQVELRVPLAVQGFRTTIIAKGQVAIDAGKVRLRLTDVTTDTGNLPSVVQNLIRQYQQRLTVTIRVPALPYSLAVNKVESSDTGLLMTASADKVSLSKV